MEIVYDQPAVAMGWRPPVLVVLWKQAPTLQAAVQVNERGSKIMSAHPGGSIFVVITSADHGAPERAAANALGQATRALEKHILAHAFIIEGQGLKAGAIRATVKTLQSLTRVIFPWTIASTTEEGILWVARKAKFLSEEEAQVILADVKAMKAAAAKG
ncbi:MULTISPECIES: hypothetical protein [unclassified Polyangium]|uniref:hypothetical protein n=1 Tax=unclassified Polyangium (in: bacteria) TaxID=3407073 RepID=UPI002482AEDC|nr:MULTISPECIES: hypothetical protein [unclassified Polyangium]MDI1475131.1 hypothetical protein [Polyangium sp. y55x31]MDI3282228.1 hypothetical protein [Polyangium sp. 15x6]